MNRQFVVAATLVSALASIDGPPRAFAQEATPAAPSASLSQAPAAQSSSDERITAGWRDGFVVQSDKGDFRLQVGLLLHADGRFALSDEAEAVNDTFVIRRIRPYLRGRVAQRFEFFVNPDFAGGTLVLQDAYLDTVFAPAFRIRVGKAKTPFGLERLHSAGNLLFFERALPTALVPNRDVGVQVLGDLSGGLISYLAGVVNGVTDGTSGDIDSSDSKDVAGRVIVRPFTKNPDSPLRGLGVAAAGSVGRQSGGAALPSLRTPSVQQPFFAYSGATADGTRTRYSPQLFYYYQRVGGFLEYVHSELPVLKASVREDISHSAWQMAGSFVLTGENATDGAIGIRPRANFDFGQGHFGALQIAARYHTLKTSDRVFALNLAAPGASAKAAAWTLGLNWYLTQNVRYVVNFERTVFDDDAQGARRPENAFVFRAQLNF